MEREEGEYGRHRRPAAYPSRRRWRHGCGPDLRRRGRIQAGRANSQGRRSSAAAVVYHQAHSTPSRARSPGAAYGFPLRQKRRTRRGPRRASGGARTGDRCRLGLPAARRCPQREHAQLTARRSNAHSAAWIRRVRDAVPTPNHALSARRRAPAVVWWPTDVRGPPGRAQLLDHSSASWWLFWNCECRGPLIAAVPPLRLAPTLPRSAPVDSDTHRRWRPAAGALCDSGGVRLAESQLALAGGPGFARCARPEEEDGIEALHAVVDA